MFFSEAAPAGEIDAETGEAEPYNDHPLYGPIERKITKPLDNIVDTVGEFKDARAFGAGISASSSTNQLGTEIGTDVILNAETWEFSAVKNESINISTAAGGGANISIYFVVITNLGSNSNLTGHMNTASATVSYGKGLSASFSWLPGTDPSDPGTTKVATFGPTGGYEATFSVADTKTTILFTIDDDAIKWFVREDAKPRPEVFDDSDTILGP